MPALQTLFVKNSQRAVVTSVPFRELPSAAESPLAQGHAPGVRSNNWSVLGTKAPGVNSSEGHPRLSPWDLPGLAGTESRFHFSFPSYLHFLNPRSFALEATGGGGGGCKQTSISQGLFPREANVSPNMSIYLDSRLWWEGGWESISSCEGEDCILPSPPKVDLPGCSQTGELIKLRILTPHLSLI